MKTEQTDDGLILTCETLREVDVLTALLGGITPHRVLAAFDMRGIDHEPEEVKTQAYQMYIEVFRAANELREKLRATA